MKKLLGIACAAAIAVALTGCGNSAKVPEKTIAAAYVDIEKAYDNGKDIAEALIKALPAPLNEDAKKQYEEAIKQIDEVKDMLNPKWAVAAFGGSQGDLSKSPENNFAVAVKISASEKDLTEKLKMMSVKPTKRNDGEVYDLGGMLVGRIGCDYVIYGMAKGAFEEMFDLYSGKGKESDKFGDLTDLSGNTIARAVTAPISSLLERFELKSEVEKFGEACEDEDLADMIIGMGAISLDLQADDDNIGIKLAIECDSSSDAEIIEHFMQSIAFLYRVGCDVGAYSSKSGLVGVFLDPGVNMDITKLKGLLGAAAKAANAERDGSSAVLSLSMDTDTLIESICKSIEEEMRK